MDHRHLSRRAALALFQTWIATNVGSDLALAYSGASRHTSETPTAVGLHYRTVDYHGRLPAWYVRGRSGLPVIVMVAGYGSGPAGELKRLVPLHTLGYGALLIEMGYPASSWPSSICRPFEDG